MKESISSTQEFIPILNWAQIYSQKGTMQPIFFFHPSITFLSYIKQFGVYNVPILIQGTDGLYDGIYYITIDTTTDIGNCPPNYNNKPRIYAGILNDEFTIYPNYPGSFQLLSE